MSIINEALKKTSKENSSHETPLAGLNLHPESKKKQTNWGPIFIISVLFLITAPIVAPLFSSPFKNTKLSSQETQLASLPADLGSSSTRKAQFVIEEAPLRPIAPLPSPAPRLNLTGLVYSQTDSYCIINDKVVKVGDSVQGARVVEVTPNSVTLEYQGDTIVLSTGE